MMGLFGSPHDLVDRHFTGGQGGFAERRLWRHLVGCVRCRERYRVHALLESLDDDGSERARDRLARSVFPAGRSAAGSTGRPSRRRSALVGGFALALAGAAALLLVRLPDDEFRARSGGAASAPSLAPSLSVFRVAPGGLPEAAGGVIRPTDGLAFAYTNPAQRARSHLMVFATDPTGRVYWYWPAWTEPATAPSAVPIGRSEAAVELPESVRHPLPPGRLMLVGLFCDRAFTVTEVEAALARGEGALEKLRCDVAREPLEVTP